MSAEERNGRNNYIAELVKKFGCERSSLLPVLQEFQRKFNHIDGDSQQEIARMMNLHPVEVQSVISFYSFLYDTPRGRNIVRLCKNIVCEFHGSNLVADALIKELHINPGGTTADGRITLELTNCFGLCDKTPSMTVNDKVYECIDRQKAINIVRQLK